MTSNILKLTWKILSLRISRTSPIINHDTMTMDHDGAKRPCETRGLTDLMKHDRIDTQSHHMTMNAQTYGPTIINT